ncbi:MAG: hypothetical protein HY335_10555 [Deinococcus sp.]|nr:hypothetical protein [Deinococcus sp.]
MTSPPRARLVLMALGLGTLLAGLGAGLVRIGWALPLPSTWPLLHGPLGVRLAGVGLVALALWLLRFDLARHNLRQVGLPRFTAVSLVLGYCWLAVGGILALAFGSAWAGPLYDALLHAVFLGFVMAAVMGHAPIIFPAVTGRRVPFRPVFYTHLGLLQLSLLLRLGGDLALWWPGRQWGGLLNAVALLLFLVNTASSGARQHH